ncbi:hypothetical protein ACIP4Q_23630 [Streptomyces massasporeus]
MDNANGSSGRAELDVRLDEAFKEQSRIVKYTSNPIVLGALGLSRYTGGIASLLSENARKRQEFRLRKFLVDFANYTDARWDSLKEHVDENFIASDEFATLVVDGLEEAGRTSDEVKLKFVMDYILNSSRIIRPDISWRDVFRTYLSQLSGTHLISLHYAFSVQEGISERERMGIVRSDRVPVKVDSFISGNYGVDENLARLCFADLANVGLLMDWRALGNPGGPVQAEYSVTQSGMLFMYFMDGKWRMKSSV